jgi:hypothetical protein
VEIDPVMSSQPGYLTVGKGTLFFTAGHNVHMAELWSLELDQLPGDIGRDGMVNSADYAGLARYFGNRSCCDLNHWCQHADLTYDGMVNMADLMVLARHWLEHSVH